LGAVGRFTEFVGGFLELLWPAGSLRHSLQDRLSKGASSGSGKSRSNEIYLKLRTSTGSLSDCMFSQVSLGNAPDPPTSCIVGL
jgi:hypothetical protein